jgi:hypothetical protein
MFLERQAMATAPMASLDEPLSACSSPPWNSTHRAGQGEKLTRRF